MIKAINKVEYIRDEQVKCYDGIDCFDVKIDSIECTDSSFTDVLAYYVIHDDNSEKRVPKDDFLAYTRNRIEFDTNIIIKELISI